MDHEDSETVSTCRVVEKLDVEDEEDRQARIQTYLERLNASSSTRFLERPSEITSKLDFGERKTFSIEPPTELLSRVHAFLPQIEASNSLLIQRAELDPQSVDIEHISEGMDQHIEMNLGLGVFEDRSQHVQNEEDSEMSTSSSDDSEAESDYDSDASSESAEIITSFVPFRPIKPLPRRATKNGSPKIVVLEKHKSS